MSRSVSIIVLTYNGLGYTKECLASLRKLTSDEVPYHLYLFDNGSTDGTVEYLESLDGITLIRSETNLGFVRGNNRAIEATPSHTDIVLLNNDIVITQGDWVAQLQRCAYSDPQVGIVGCRLRDRAGGLAHAGTVMPTSTYWGQQIGGDRLEKDINQYNRDREVEGVIGACMYIRREVIERIGLLDEDYISYFEDTDYCLRARQAGFTVKCAGGVTLTHYQHGAGGAKSATLSRTFRQSQRTFISKWQKRLEERYGLGVMWHSLFNLPTGYALSSRQLVLTLDQLHVDVRLAYIYGVEYMEPLTDDYRLLELKQRPKDLSLPQVVYAQGDTFIKNSGRYKIGFTMLEVDGVPQEWVEQANLMDEVWVPSGFNLQTFRESGVERPIYIQPLGVDPDYFNPQIKPFRPSERFTFLSTFEWGPRKAPEVLLRAYTEEFKEKEGVLLLLKVASPPGEEEVRRDIANMGLRRGHASIYLLCNRQIPAYQMGSLYRSADCFVLPTRGEGWGMPILEAMACGLPVIATDWGGHRDFFDEEVGYPLRVRAMLPADETWPYYRGFRWAEPDLEHLRCLMRYVYEHREEARDKGTLASQKVLAGFTWRDAAQKIRNRLEEIES